jgi:hypothetical protein
MRYVTEITNYAKILASRLNKCTKLIFFTRGGNYFHLDLNIIRFCYSVSTSLGKVARTCLEQFVCQRGSWYESAASPPAPNDAAALSEGACWVALGGALPLAVSSTAARDALLHIKPQTWPARGIVA